MKTRCLALACLLILVHFTASTQQWKEFSDSAKHYLTQKKPDKAIDFFLNAKALLRPDSSHSNTYVQLCKSLSLAYFNLGQRDKAEPVLLEAVSILEKLNRTNDADYALFNDMLGQKYFNTDPKKAEAYFITAKNVREIVMGSSSAEFAQSCNNLGAIYNNNGSWNKALQLHLQAKEIREKLGDSLALAQSCNNLGDLYRITGQLELAEPNCQKAKAIREIFYLRNPGLSGRVYAISCVGLANLYRDMGQYKKAEPLYIEARNVREQVLTKKHPDYAASCDILATLYHSMGENEKAEQLFIEAKTLRENISPAKQSLPYAESIDNLANLYRNMGRFKEAEEQLLKAKAIWEKELNPTDPALAINNNNAGLLYSAMGDYSNAEVYFLKARNLWQKIASTDHPSYAANSDNLATVYWNTNRTQKANQLFTESFYTQYDQLVNFFQFTSEKEKQDYIENIAGSGDRYYSFCYKWGFKADHVYNLSLLNRNLILNAAQELRNTVYRTNDTALTSVYEQWITTKQQLANIYSGRIYIGKKEVTSLEERSDFLEKEITKRTSLLQKKDLKTNNWRPIQQELKPGEAAIEFVEFTYFNGKKWTDSTFYMALVLKKKTASPVLIKLFEKRQLQAILNKYSGKNANDVAKGLYTINSPLYNLVWQPLEKELAGTSKIYFAPSGLLHQLSFSAIPSAKQLLSDKYHLVQLNTTAAILDEKNKGIASSEKIMLYGGVEYSVDSSALVNAVQVHHSNSVASRSLPDDLSRGEKWNALPGSKKEIDAIEKMGSIKNYRVELTEGIYATEESIKSINGQSSPQVLHIATHGFYSPDPKQNSLSAKFATSGKVFKQSDNPLFRSGLLLAGANNTWSGKPVHGIEDGILTAYEVSNMYLPNTKLVVLSACETALGDIQGSEGVYGLQRALKMAGAQNLVMSLWKVPDAETAEFMQEFYKHLFNKQPISDAFYRAQTTMKNKYRSEPYKWAAWVLIR